MIRLFVSDVDGTLLNEKSQLEEETVEAIRRFQKQGGIFMLGTGRNPWELEEVTSKVDNVILNCVNGAVLCKEDGTVIHAHFLDPEAVEKIIGYCRDTDTPVCFHGEDCTYTFWEKERFVDRAKESFRKIYSEDFIDDLCHIIFDREEELFSVPEEEIVKRKIAKAEIMFMKDDVSEFLKKRCLEELTGCSICFVDFMSNIEVTSDQADKGLAICAFCRLKGIDEDEAAVVGDGGNDVSMLVRFRNSYAMANADASAKAAAARICASNRELGVARLLNEICDLNDREKE